jgi:4-hydroxybenzoate polyprenyltransferase
MRKGDAIKFFFSVKLAARAFPYERYLLTLFPAFALLLASNKIGASEILLFLLAFAFAMAAGFIYNVVCDAEKDPEAKNPITRGDMSTKGAIRVVVLSLVVAIVLFIWASQSKLAIFLFVVYLCLCLAYSGLSVRLKESVLGPFAASFVMWSAPPLLVLVSFSYLNISAGLLVLGLFSIYACHEIEHTLIDHDLDVASDYRTFAVTVGPARASIGAYTALTFGSVFLLASAYFPPPSFSATILLLFALLFIISIVSTVVYVSRRDYNLRGGARLTAVPYVVTGMFIITFGLTVLRVPLLFVFFALWFYLVSPWPFQ